MKIVAAILVTLGLLVLAILLTPKHSPSQPVQEHQLRATGARDFISYWSSWRLMRLQMNLYDGNSYAQGLGFERSDRLVMFNPPWAAWLVAPVGWLPFPSATLGWLGFNCMALVTSVWFLSKSANSTPSGRGRLNKTLFLPLLFAPAALALQLGQFSALLLLATCGAYAALLRGNAAACGAWFAILSIKPHLFFLLVPVVAAWMLQRRQWSFFGVGAAVFITWVLMTLWFHPGCVGDWWAFIHGGTPMEWVGSNLPAWIRLTFYSLTGQLPTWPNMVVPGLGLIAATALYVPKLQQIDWNRDFPLLLALSVFFSPYGHPYDQLLTLPLYWQLIQELPRSPLKKQTILMVAILASTQIFWILQISILSPELHYLAWLPPVLLAIWTWRRPWLRLKNC